jgi:uncharacterized protein
VSERTHYPSGVPCWVDTLQPDPDAAVRFYAELFGWQFEGPGPMPGEPPGRYFVARLRGRDVAGIGSQPPQTTGLPAFWNTYVAVESADAACAKAREAGGSILAEPFDALPAGRAAVVRDPAGATFCVWEAKDRQGAQRVNEAAAWAMSALLTRQSGACGAFYAAVFGWQTEPFGPPDAGITLLRLPGYVGGEPHQPVPRDVVAVMLPVGDGFPQDRPAEWSVGFWIDDVDAAAIRATAAAAKLVVPPHDEIGFRRATIADPWGAVFSISQLKM